MTLLCDIIFFGDEMVYVRKAKEDDISKLYNYLNKKYVENNLKNIEEHETAYKTWYKENLNSKHYVLLIIEDDKKTFLGHIKYKITTKKSEVMIHIIEEYRSSGIAKKALEIKAF